MHFNMRRLMGFGFIIMDEEAQIMLNSMSGMTCTIVSCSPLFEIHSRDLKVPFVTSNWVEETVTIAETQSSSLRVEIPMSLFGLGWVQQSLGVS